MAGYHGDGSPGTLNPETLGTVLLISAETPGRRRQCAPALISATFHKMKPQNRPSLFRLTQSQAPKKEPQISPGSSRVP